METQGVESGVRSIVELKLYLLYIESFISRYHIGGEQESKHKGVTD